MDKPLFHQQCSANFEYFCSASGYQASCQKLAGALIMRADAALARFLSTSGRSELSHHAETS